MRTRERGIGNMPFIALLVLLVIAIALVFVFKDEAASNRKKYEDEFAKNQKSIVTLDGARKAYDAWKEVSGLAIPELEVKGDTYPTRDVILDKVRTWLAAQAQEIATKSQAKVPAKQYQLDRTSNVVKVTDGEPATITLFGTTLAKETLTVQGFLAPLGEQFRYAAKAIEDNNALFENEYKSYQTRTGQLATSVSQAQSQYQADVAQKAQLYDTEKSRADQMQDQVHQLTTRVDADAAKHQADRTTWEKEKRTLSLENQALTNRIRQDRTKMELAIKEDAKDGEVLVADQRQGLVFINLGKNFRVAPNMKFMVWRFGKGNIREDIAEVRVIEVENTRSTCRILKWLNPRVPVAQGMSVSNPFYDPHKRLRVYLYGNLRYYTSDLAKRRLAESGCDVAPVLDETVNVVVLGEPSVEIGAEAESPEEVAAAEERAKVARAARIRDVMETAASLGAVVVTEEVLRTFVEY